ncbi:MAG: serine acetyltransferase, partial [Flavobacteriaceae bacterium]|nr:serine acetyltransferase [Flavobacteriaceae bacterium]
AYFVDYTLKKKTEAFTDKIFHSLFCSSLELESTFNALEKEFLEITDIVCINKHNSCKKEWYTFLQNLPEILKKLNKDAEFMADNDPAANSIEEIFLSYPGFIAIAIYRISHEFYKIKIPLVPRLMSEYAHFLSGVDINPGATIGSPFFIDHATGIVIGETTVIKDYVKIYQGVTLGALQVSKDMQHKKRHPTIESNVTIYSNTTILGGDTIIGSNSTIGGNVWITDSVPKNSLVYHQPVIKTKPIKYK